VIGWRVVKLVRFKKYNSSKASFSKRHRQWSICRERVGRSWFNPPLTSCKIRNFDKSTTAWSPWQLISREFLFHHHLYRPNDRLIEAHLCDRYALAECWGRTRNFSDTMWLSITFCIVTQRKKNYLTPLLPSSASMHILQPTVRQATRLHSINL
jgi:hypothetical protein